MPCVCAEGVWVVGGAGYGVGVVLGFALGGGVEPE